MRPGRGTEGGVAPKEVLAEALQRLVLAEMPRYLGIVVGFEHSQLERLAVR